MELDYSASYDPHTAGGNGAKYFGHADLDNALAAGRSVDEIKSWMNANLDKMPGGKGKNSKVYQDVMAMPSGGNSSNNSSGNNFGGGYSGGGGQQQMAGSQEFQENLNEATQAYRPKESNMNKYLEGNYDDDFKQGLMNEQAIKETDPFGDSWNSVDFFGKYITMGRQAQQGRGDASGIANKYIFNASQTNPVDIAALDKKIRTNPLYSEAKADLSKLNTFGDTYSQGSPNWVQPQSPSSYEPPDFNSIYDKTKKDIESI